MGVAEADNTNGRGWVWWSTPYSRARGLLSLLAVAETLLAVTAYWWLAQRMELGGMLLVASPFAAMLVLFRSPESRAAGLNVWKRLEAEPSDRRPAGRWVWLLGSVIALGLGWAVQFSGIIDTGQSDAIRPVYAFIVGCIFPICAVATMPSKVRRAWPLLPHFGLCIVIIMILLPPPWAEITASFDRLVLGVGSISSQTLPPILLSVFLGFPLGISLLATAIRLGAVLRFIMPGLRSFPQNFKHLVLSEDLLVPPTLMPGDEGLWPDRPIVLPRRQDLSSMWRDRPPIGDIVGSTVFGGLVIAILFLPVMAYRLTLKSTAWIYLPLIWIAHVPDHLRSIDGRQVWVGYVGRRLWDWVVFFSALMVLLCGLVLAFDTARFAEVLVETEGQPRGPLTLAFALDLARLPLWSWVTIPMAGLTVWLTFWFDHIRKLGQAGAAPTEGGWQMRMLIAVHRLRSGLFWLWMAITLVSLMLLSWDLGKLPGWIEPLVDVARPLAAFWGAK